MLKELRIHYFIYFEHILCWIGGQRIGNTNESHLKRPIGDRSKSGGWLRHRLGLVTG